MDETSGFFGFHVGGDRFDSRKDAETYFIHDLDRKLYWIRGYKFWRVKPEIGYFVDFEKGNNKVWYARARITASIEEPPKDFHMVDKDEAIKILKDAIV